MTDPTDEFYEVDPILTPDQLKTLLDLGLTLNHIGHMREGVQIGSVDEYMMQKEKAALIQKIMEKVESCPPQSGGGVFRDFARGLVCGAGVSGQVVPVKGQAAPKTTLQDLPYDVLFLILQRLTVEDVGNLASTTRAEGKEVQGALLLNDIVGPQLKIALHRFSQFVIDAMKEGFYALHDRNFKLTWTYKGIDDVAFASLETKLLMRFDNINGAIASKFMFYKSDWRFKITGIFEGLTFVLTFLNPERLDYSDKNLYFFHQEWILSSISIGGEIVAGPDDLKLTTPLKFLEDISKYSFSYLVAFNQTRNNTSVFNTKNDKRRSTKEIQNLLEYKWARFIESANTSIETSKKTDLNVEGQAQSTTPFIVKFDDDDKVSENEVTESDITQMKKTQTLSDLTHKFDTWSVPTPIQELINKVHNRGGLSNKYVLMNMRYFQFIGNVVCEDPSVKTRFFHALATAVREFPERAREIFDQRGGYFLDPKARGDQRVDGYHMVAVAQDTAYWPPKACIGVSNEYGFSFTAGLPPRIHTQTLMRKEDTGNLYQVPHIYTLFDFARAADLEIVENQVKKDEDDTTPFYSSISFKFRG